MKLMRALQRHYSPCGERSTGPSSGILVQYFLDTGDCLEDKLQLKGRGCQPVRNTKQGTSLTHLHRWITMRNSLSCQQSPGFWTWNICPWSYWNKWVFTVRTLFNGLLLFLLLFYVLELYLQGFFISVETLHFMQKKDFFMPMCFQKMELHVKQQLSRDV